MFELNSVHPVTLSVISILILFSHLRWVSQVGLVSRLDFVCISHLCLLCYLLIYLTHLHTILLYFGVGVGG